MLPYNTHLKVLLFSKTIEPQASAAESLADETEVDTSLGKDVDDPS